MARKKHLKGKTLTAIDSAALGQVAGGFLDPSTNVSTNSGNTKNSGNTQNNSSAHTINTGGNAQAQSNVNTGPNTGNSYGNLGPTNVFSNSGYFSSNGQGFGPNGPLGGGGG